MRSRGVWRLRATIAVLATALLAVLTACANSTPAASSPTSKPQPIPAAQAKLFVPVTASVSRTVHGSCWTGSITVRSDNAYRCFAGKQILDPCFATARSAHEVVCYADPWTAGVRVVLTKALPRTTPLAVSHPWAIELANGQRCVAATGIVKRIGDLALLYQCRGGGATGAPVSRGGHTEVEYVAADSHLTVAVAVTVIWQA